MKERHRDLLKLDKWSRRELQTVLLLLLLSDSRTAPASSLDLLLRAPLISRGIGRSLLLIQRRASELADRHARALPQDSEPSKKEAEEAKVAVRSLLVSVVTLVNLSERNTFRKKVEQALEEASWKVDRFASTEAFRAYDREWRATQEGAPPGKWIWDSTLDKRTCPRCESLHGRSWNNLGSVPSQPLHPSCRCILTFEAS